MRKILLTGAGGLVGTHLLPLLNKDYEVYTISGKNISSNKIKPSLVFL